MKLLKNYLPQAIFYPILIGLIGLAVALANFEPNTFLTGWDTLHPEFNFPLAFERAINGVWRADQGLGTVAIQSHMAELPRIFLLWILSFVFPLESLRYITMLTPLIIGPLGVYFLSQYFLKSRKFDHTASFLASLSYLMSLGTVQHFAVPLEMFAIHFAFLPWAILLLLKYLETGSKKFLGLFALNTIFLIPQAHTATLLYVYILAIFGVIGTFIILNRKKKFIYRGIFLVLVTILLNAYIIFPNFYAAINHGDEVHNSRINRFFSQEAFAKNQQFGNLENASIAKSFLFDWQLYDFEDKKSVEVLSEWKQNLKNPYVLGFGYLVFIVAAIGAIKSILKRDKKALLLLPISIIAFLVLLNGTFPMTWVFSNLSLISETLKEALRFPFTKFSILYMLGLSIFFAIGVQFIFEKLNKEKLNKFLTLAVTIGFIIYFIPAFKGNLINPSMRVAIPQEYFEMFEFFNSQNKDERVAILPIHSFWGWVYNTWGYQGAGFLQFGIKQPILDRDHDRWSSFNEQYQREMKYAIYSQNVNLIRDVLKKYDVKWILFDTSVTNLSGYQHETLSWQIPDMMGRFDDIKLIKKFGENLYVYEFKNPESGKVSVYKNMPDAGPTMVGSHKDRIYSELKTYKTKNILSKDFEAENYIFDEHFVGKINSSPIITIDSKNPLSEGVACSNANSNRSIENESIRYESTNGPLCDYFSFPNLSHEKAYIVTIESKNIEGFPLQLYICNDLSLHCNQTIYLKPNKTPTIEAFVIPAYYDYGTGHTININNYSIKNKSSVNELIGIKIYEYLPKAFTSEQNRAQLLGNTEIVSQMPGKITVKLDDNISDKTTITLSERYHTGWKAYRIENGEGRIENWIKNAFPFFFGEEMVDHFKVNNWANGWDISNSQLTTLNSQLVIVFMPQYLEYLGIILAGLPIVILLALFTKDFIPQTLSRINKLNSFFEKGAEFFKLKINETNNKNLQKAFPYSINLAGNKRDLAQLSILNSQL